MTFPKTLKVIILLLVYTTGVLSQCSKDNEIHCHRSKKCVKIQYVCDGDNDCGDYSDENQELCYAWRNEECPSGKAYCPSSTQSDTCVDLKTYCENGACDGNVDQRLCQILNQGKLRPLSETDSLRCNESKTIQCETSDKCIKINFICDDDNDCGDNSDENEELCNAWKNDDCPKGEVKCGVDEESQCVSIASYCKNQDCQDNLDRRLCTILSEKKLQPLYEIKEPSGTLALGDIERAVTKGEDFLVALNYTLRHENCPPFYSKVGEDCLSLFFFSKLTWGEARAFCNFINGDLYVPRDDKAFRTLVHHLRQHQLTSDFWLGGTYSKSKGWKWVNDEPIETGTLDWAIRHSPKCSTREIHLEYREKTLEANEGSCYHYFQAPGNHPSGSCVAVTYEKLFFMSDENCLLKKSPLCKLKTEVS